MDSKTAMMNVTERFQVDLSRQLGRGSYGVVYEGYDREKKKKIAVKCLKSAQSFQAEISTLEKLSSLTHSYIMGFYGFKNAQKDVYLFIEHCPGVLTDLIEKGLEEERVLELFRQIVQGMCYMNAKGLAHRDLKPDNILIGSSQEVKISDFGLAKDFSLQLSGMIGTPLYAGPQIFDESSKESYDMNCDVWSAGLILYQMLTGKHLFKHVKTYSELKSEWKKYQKAEKRITYQNVHPHWQYLTNIMLTYNFKKRPSFHSILEILKLTDDDGMMRKQITSRKLGIEWTTNSESQAAEKYLSFVDQKLDVLTGLIEPLTHGQYPYLRESYKKIIIFFALSRCVSRIKKLVRGLKHFIIKFPDGNLLMQKGKKNNSLQLIMDRYPNIYEFKSTKYLNYLKQQVLNPLITSVQGSFEEQLAIEAVRSAYDMVCKMSKGEIDIEDNYIEEYIKFINHPKVKPTDAAINSMKVDEIEVYLWMILPAYIDVEFPEEKFLEKDFVKSKLKELIKSPGVAVKRMRNYK